MSNSGADLSVILDSLALAGYRSYGREYQRFTNLAKVNILIGQNNSGKSNVLRFIHDWLSQEKPPRLSDHDRPLPDRVPLSYGFRLSCTKNGTLDQEVLQKEYGLNPSSEGLSGLVALFRAKMDIDRDTVGPWFYFDEGGIFQSAEWVPAFGAVQDGPLHRLWSSLIHHTGGSRKEHWIPETLPRLAPARPSFQCHLIPAIRKIGIQGSTSEGFSGEGLIERLAKLQNPPAQSQQDKERFKKIGDFLRTVTDNRSAEIEIPYERDTILIRMDGKTLPLESLGTGLHEVIILAAAATVLENSVICMEEPELHLNPILQKKLIRYLRDSTTNQYFITTHSAALMDTPDAEVYHITLEQGASHVDRVTSDRHRSTVCEDLGYHPSDLLQTNSIVWVEGPSDRLYINWWLQALAPELIEGIHYSIMFYGGRLASHVTGNDVDDAVSDFISLRRLNRRGVMVIDSDRSQSGARINDTKSRLKDEFDAGPGHAWITDGREIENYLDPQMLKDAIQATHPSSTVATSLEKFDNALSVLNRKGETIQAAKVKVANWIVSSQSPTFDRLNLRQRVNKLIGFVRESNPQVMPRTDERH